MSVECLTETTIIANRFRSTTYFLIAVALAFTSACSESDIKCTASTTTQLTSLDHEVDYKSLNTTSLNSEVAKLYGIDQDESLGVVMVSVYQTDDKGIGVDACVSGGLTNLVGQKNRLRFEEIREGSAIYHISTFPFSHKDHLTFNVDVQIAVTGKIHKLKWKQQFWRG